MKKIYIDSNILVSYFATGPKSERTRKNQIANAFKVISSLNVELYMSMWTITEFVKVMINTKDIKPREVNKIATELARSTSIKGQEINMIKASPVQGYNCDNLFYGVREIMTLYNPGFGDAFQAVIMRNHGIKEILSFDRKDDFQIIPELTVIDPRTFIKPILVPQP
jgi:predicted nucleic acid-binding protein